jgi:hypothetical protein
MIFGFVLPNGETGDGQKIARAFADAKIPFSVELPQLPGKYNGRI